MYLFFFVVDDVAMRVDIEMSIKENSLIEGKNMYDLKILQYVRHLCWFEQIR